ncbi:MAG: type II secretion system protein [Phycisphaerales bacterium]|nr:type II secretion system protein [Phycisphaerales bacterium]
MDAQSKPRAARHDGCLLGGAARQRGAKTGAGFTLIETILVILLIMVLVAMLLPSLGQARWRARTAMSASQLRSHGQVLAAYVGDWDDAWPWFADPQATWTVVRCQERGTSVKIKYFQSANNWNYALADRYYDGQFDHEAFYPPGMPDSVQTYGHRGGPTPYSLGCSFIADPKFWRPESRTGPRQWRLTRASELLFPTDKTLLASDWPLLAELPNPIPPVTAARAGMEMCFADGSAESLSTTSLRAGYEGSDGVFDGSWHITDFPYAVHTLEGVKGRDR